MFNHTEFENPDTAFTDTTFGQISTTYARASCRSPALALLRIAVDDENSAADRQSPISEIPLRFVHTRSLTGL